jgi:MoaA/NifB/PqqE/SkfB family radical SAM enzyme
MIRKTVIIMGYRCNCHCVFCCNAHKRSLPDRSTDDILVEMARARRRGCTYLELIGGEGTIRKDILQLVSQARRIGFEEVVMASNGRMFAYPHFARDLVDAGVTHLVFSIHGHTAALHDSLTRSPGSFGQLIEGIGHIRRFRDRCPIGSNTTIVKGNYRALEEIGKFIYSLGIRNAEFIFVDPTQGAAFSSFARIVPRLSVMAPYARKCLEFGKARRIPHWHLRYVPLCLFPGHEDRISELAERKTFITEHVAGDFVNFDVQSSRASVGRIKPPKCRKCAKFARCEGLWKEYYRHYGDKELLPDITHA